MNSKDKGIRFIGHFLKWYQDSYSLPDVVNRIKLEELVKEAEEIHTQRIKEMYNDYKETVVSTIEKPTKTVKKQVKRLVKRKRISRYL